MTTSNTPFFRFTTSGTDNGSSEWSFLGSPATGFNWTTAPTTTTTQDVVFDMECATGGDGHNNIKIDGATPTAYSFISTENPNDAIDCLNRWWASDIRNIYGAYMTGPTVYHVPDCLAASRLAAAPSGRIISTSQTSRMLQ